MAYFIQSLLARPRDRTYIRLTNIIYDVGLISAPSGISVLLGAPASRRIAVNGIYQINWRGKRSTAFYFV